MKNFLKKNKKYFTRYIINGLVLNGGSFLIYILLTSIFFSFRPLYVVIFLNPLFIFINYILQNAYVFNSQPSIKQSLKYLILVFGSYCFNIFSIYLLVDIFYLNHIFVQALVVIVIATASFFIGKKIFS